jgi:tetratricopeptide (TPR) repeat protein
MGCCTAVRTLGAGVLSSAADFSGATILNSELSNAVRILILSLVFSAFSQAESASEALVRAEPLISREQFAEAEAILASASKSEPASVELLYRLGYVRYRQRKLGPARIAFTDAVTLSPTAWYSMYFLGQIELLENHPAAAIRWLQPVAEQEEPVFDASSRLAAAYAQTGNIPKAEEALKLAIAQAPWDGSLYFRLGSLQKKRGESSLARESFGQSSRLRKASQEDVQILMTVARNLRDKQYQAANEAGRGISGRADVDPAALVALGVLYGSANQHREALEAFDAAATRDPRFFAAQMNRGLALLRTGEISKASEALAKARLLLPQSAEANLGLGLSYAMQGRYSDAVDPLKQALRKDPANQKTGALLATAYLRTNSAAQAVTLLRSMKTSEDITLSLLLIDALTAAHDLNGALQSAHLTRQRFPDVPQAHLAEAQVLVRLGRYREAQPRFSEALKIKPDWAEAQVGLADCLQKSGDHEKATQYYRAALPVASTALAARLGLTRSLVALRRLEEAQSILEETVRSYPSELAVHTELSRVYARLGRTDLAADQARIADELRVRQTPGQKQ